MRLPRNINAKELIQLLSKLNYQNTRQTGSHIRLTNSQTGHHITIPNHKPIKIGTLNNILNDLSMQTGVNKEKLITLLIS